jgi:hypothetical protein
MFLKQIGAKMNNRDIYKIDNFLPTRYHSAMSDLVFSNYFPWFYLENSAFERRGDFDENHFSFSNSIYVDDVKSPHFDFFLPMIYQIPLELAEDIEVIRIRAGMQTKILGEVVVNDPHVDMESDHYTLLYYVNDSDGDTVFYKDSTASEVIMSNTPVANSAIIFDGNIYHASSHPTTVPARVAININYRKIN